MHDMWTIAVDVSGMCKSVSLSVHLAALHGFAVIKWLNGLRSYLG